MREVKLPSEFLSDFVCEAGDRLELLRARIAELSGVVTPILSGSGRYAGTAVTIDTLKQVISGEHAAFMRLAGAKVSPAHDTIDDLKRDVMDLIQRELNAMVADKRVDLSSLHATGGIASTQSLRAVVAKAVDPFAAADSREKSAKEKRARQRAEYGAPKPAQPTAVAVQSG